MITLLLSFYQSQAQIQLVNESFATVVPLPTGWAQQNLSTTIGTTPTWFQGNPTVFPANSTPTNSYIAANYNSTTLTNTISNWLFMPEISMRNGDVLT